MTQPPAGASSIAEPNFPKERMLSLPLRMAVVPSSEKVVQPARRNTADKKGKTYVFIMFV